MTDKVFTEADGLLTFSGNVFKVMRPWPSPNANTGSEIGQVASLKMDGDRVFLWDPGNILRVGDTLFTLGWTGAIIEVPTTQQMVDDASHEATKSFTIHSLLPHLVEAPS